MELTFPEGMLIGFIAGAMLVMCYHEWRDWVRRRDTLPPPDREHRL
jgi:hypothetical protein